MQLTETGQSPSQAPAQRDWSGYTVPAERDRGEPHQGSRGGAFSDPTQLTAGGSGGDVKLILNAHILNLCDVPQNNSQFLPHWILYFGDPVGENSSSSELITLSHSFIENHLALFVEVSPTSNRQVPGLGK